jgi:type VI secretion system protein ImpB
MAPRLALKVDNKLTNDGSKMNTELRFNSLQDFEPDNVVQQVEPLRKLVEARQKLRDLLSKTDGNDRLEELLQGRDAEHQRAEAALRGSRPGRGEGQGEERRGIP